MIVLPVVLLFLIPLILKETDKPSFTCQMFQSLSLLEELKKLMVREFVKMLEKLIWADFFLIGWLQQNCHTISHLL